MATVATKTVHRSRGIVRINCSITVDASGDAALVDIGGAWGSIKHILYDAGDLATGVDITLTDKRTGAVLFSLVDAGTSDLMLVPSINVSGQTKAVIAAATTDTNVRREVFVAGDMQLLVAQGGVSKSGKFDIIIDEGFRRI